MPRRLGARGVVGAAFALAVVGAFAFVTVHAVRRGAATHGAVLTGHGASFDVELSGCAAMRLAQGEDGGDGVRRLTCDVADDGVLRAWVAEADDSPVVFRTLRGPLEPASRESVLGGVRFTLKLNAHGDEGALRVMRRRSGETFAVHLAHAAPFAALDDANARRKKGDFEGAKKALESALPALDANDGARATSLLARVALAAGNVPEAQRLLRDAIALDHAAGRLSDEVDDGLVLAFSLTARSRRFAEAREALNSARRASADYPDGKMRGPYFEAILAAETGDLRGAMERLDEARDRAARLGVVRLRRNAQMEQGLTLVALGRPEAALEIFRALDAEDAAGRTPCEASDLTNNIGWAMLAMRDRGLSVGANTNAGPNDPTPILEAALTLARDGCAEPSRTANVLVSLAYAALQKGDSKSARAYLAEAKKAQPDPNGALALHWLEIEGRAALVSSSPTAPRDAIAAFANEARLAAASLAPESVWRATVGKASALEQANSLELALGAYADAERLLDDRALAVPLGEGRDAFLGEHERSARQQIDLLLRRNRVAEAFEAARHARARIVSAVQREGRIGALASKDRAEWEASLGAYRREREALDSDAAGDWKLPADTLTRARVTRKAREAKLRASLDSAFAVLGRAGEAEPPEALRPPRDGEVVLVMHPVRGGWAVFAATTSETRVRRVDGADALTEKGSPDALAGALLMPFREQIANASQLRVLAYGPLRDVDVHALPWGAGHLVDAIAVTYPLDLGVAANASDGAHASAPQPVGTTLVVADPNGDLPAARREASALEALLGDAGAGAVVSLHGEAATLHAVSEALGRGNLAQFHYAGHGIFAGHDGWESELPLAQNGRLTIGDILALPHAPPRVVLSSCESSRSSASGAPEGLGLAQAFVAAGSTSVVAPTRPVADALAAAMTSALYRSLATEDDVPRALARAQRDVRAAMPESDWASYRVIVP